MCELPSVGVYFSESIHVELSHEAGEVVVFEVLRQYVPGELRRLPDHEAVSIWRPRHGGCRGWVAHHRVGFAEEGCRLVRISSTVGHGRSPPASSHLLRPFRAAHVRFAASNHRPHDSKVWQAPRAGVTTCTSTPHSMDPTASGCLWEGGLGRGRVRRGRCTPRGQMHPGQGQRWERRGGKFVEQAEGCECIGHA